MSTYHCSVKIISRSAGRSSVGAAAYRAGEKITNERDGITHDYTRKGGVVYSEIMLPENTPIQYSERAYLWNDIERIEKSINSQTAREIEVALPRELNQKEQTDMLREYIQDTFVSRGMIADFAIHNRDKGNNNPHAHIMLTMRSMDREGKWEPKAKKVYVMDENGNKIYNKKTRQYKCHKQSTNDWDKKENAEIWRESWARIYNREMEKKNIPDRVDHRSYKRQGIDREPTIHKGPAAHQMGQRGIRTERGDINREIENRNRGYANTIIEVRENVAAYTADGVSRLPYAREDFKAYGIEIPAAPQETTILKYSEPRENLIGFEDIQEKENTLSQLLRAKKAEASPQHERQRDTESRRQDHGRDIPASEKSHGSISDQIKNHVEQKRELKKEEFTREIEKAPVKDRSVREGSTIEETNARSFIEKMERKVNEHNELLDLRKKRIEAANREKALSQSQEKKPSPPARMHVRGDMENARGIEIPFYTRVTIEMSRCEHIDNIYGMARSLSTIRQENIQSYGELNRKIEKNEQETQNNANQIKALEVEKSRAEENARLLETYERNLHCQREIENAGRFQKKKLEKEYEYQLGEVRRSSEGLRREGIDPQKVTAAYQYEFAKAIEFERVKLREKHINTIDKTTALKESRDMMNQLFQDRGLDLEMRQKMQKWELKHYRHRGRER